MAQWDREVASNERFYDRLSVEDRTFFKQQTRIQDDEELKAHILQVQTEAIKVRIGMGTANH